MTWRLIYVTMSELKPTFGIILPYVLCVKHKHLFMIAPTGQVFPYTAKRKPRIDHFRGRWIKQGLFASSNGRVLHSDKYAPDNTMRETKTHSDYMGNYSPLMILIVWRNGL